MGWLFLRDSGFVQQVAALGKITRYAPDFPVSKELAQQSEHIVGIKPGKNDKKCELLVQGEDLQALQEITHCFCECFGLDTRIDNYKGKRSMSLYQWDFECLLEGIYDVINNKKEIPWVNANDRIILIKLHHRIKNIYNDVYGSE